jgi:hypothetical protein
MEPFSVSTQLDTQDWRALQQAAARRLWSPSSLPRRFLLRAPVLLIFVMLFVGVLWLDRDDLMLAWVVGIVATLLLGVIQAQIAQRTMRPKPGGLALGPIRYDFNAAGITITRPNSSAQMQWSQVRTVDTTAMHLFLWLDQAVAYNVPVRDLPAPLTGAEAAARIRSFASASVAATPVLSVAEVPQPLPVMTAPARPEPPRAVWSELGAVLQLLLMLPVNGARFVGSDLAIGLLAVVLLAIWIPLDPWVFEGPLTYAPMAWSGLVFVMAGAVALAYLLARLSQPPVEYRRVLLIVTGSMAIAILGSTLAALASPRWWIIVVGAMSGYATLYFKRAFLALTGIVQTRSLLIGAAATMFFVLFMDHVAINPSLWEYTDTAEYDDSGDPEDSGDGSSAEDFDRMTAAQFGQQQLIADQVSNVGAHGASGSQVYFLGFAGVGEQRVFAEEIDLAARRVAARYGAVDRQLRLVNDRRSLDHYPLATAPALRYALQSLGAVMDRDDVLFLALSSHGGDDATLAISNLGMVPAALGAEELADDLRESGIRWKVIVISACYAGGFIDALKDDHTIVITAAAADRTSFGCSDENDLTYFGEAFYRDAWPKAISLRAAFDAAKVDITAREKKEKITASNPQASFGSAMEAKLAGLDVQGSSVAPIR